jgi:hypothetical protein
LKRLFEFVVVELVCWRNGYYVIAASKAIKFVLTSKVIAVLMVADTARTLTILACFAADMESGAPAPLAVRRLSLRQT